MLWGAELVGSWKPAQLPAQRLKYLTPALWIIALPAYWVTIEYLVMNIPLVMKIGGAIGYTSISGTQWRNVPLLQLASFTGMYGVSFLIVLVNCAIAFAIVHLKRTRSAVVPAAVAISVLVAIHAWGALAVLPLPAHGVKAVIIQVSDGYQDDPASFDDLIAESLDYHPEIIMLGLPSGQSPVDRLSDEARKYQFYLLHGTELLSPDGKRSHHDVTYHFMNVPDGFSPWEPSRIVAPPVDTFDTTFGKVSSLICMESAYPYPARKGDR